MTNARYFAWWILGFLNVLLGATTECGLPSYGSDCQNTCNCKGSCGVDGSCADGCSYGWFGPQCLYDDLSADSVTDPPTHFPLLDGDDGMCVNTSDVLDTRVVFENPVSLSWMRITFKSQVSPDGLAKLQVQFRTAQQSEGQRTACVNKSLIIRPMAVDIVCKKVADCGDIFFHLEDLPLVCSMSFAQECYPGHYGPDCVSRCSEACLDNLCDYKDGSCVNCPSGHTGLSCEKDCEPTYYGINCQLRCSKNCLNQFCSRTTGHCLACPLGRTGHTCEQENLPDFLNDSFLNDTSKNKTSTFIAASTVDHTIVLIVALVSASVALSVVAVFIYRRRTKLCKLCLRPRYPKYRPFTTSETDFSTEDTNDTVIMN